MARKTHRQRSELPANRELRRALSAERPKAFGVRRFVADSDNRKLQDIWDELQSQGDIPEEVKPRIRKGVTLLPRKQLGAQMTRGLVLGYNLGRAHHEFDRDNQLLGTKHTIPAMLGEVAVLDRRVVWARVVSEELDTERERIYSILGSLGFRGGYQALDTPLHITLGESNRLISRIEVAHLTDTFNNAIFSAIPKQSDKNLLGVEPVQSREDDDIRLPINLQEWDVYPSLQHTQAVYDHDF